MWGDDANRFKKGFGKSSFDEKSIIANIYAFIKAVSIAKPSGSKGVYMCQML